jgi:hypothetical protein
MIRRVIGIAAMAVVAIVTTASLAMAQTSSYPISPSGGASVKGVSGSRGGGAGTAFTGSSQIPLGTVLLVTLVVVGLGALLVARRRAARFAS